MMTAEKRGHTNGNHFVQPLKAIKNVFDATNEYISIVSI